MDEQKRYEYSTLPPDPKGKYGHSGQFWRKKRYVISILGFFGFFNGYALRTNLSVAIVDMTKLKNVTLKDNTTVLERQFDWDSRLQGYVLSSFYYGYIITQILGGYLATRFGGVKIFGGGIACTAVFTILTPWVAKTNVYLLIVVRTLEGFFEGVTYPAILQIWANWAPPLEKSRLATIALSGTYVGNVVALPVSSLLTTAFGWETVFYAFGTFTLIWYLIWLIVVRDSPSEDSTINPDELKYITESINATDTSEKVVIPWLALLNSSAVWSMTATLSCETWGWYTMIMFLPKMMNSLLGFDLNKSGFLAALPYIAMTVTVQTGGQLSDWFATKKYLTITQIRKIAICVGFSSQALCLLAAAFWISPIATPALLTVGAAFGGLALSGIVVNPLDIAPKLASVIYGLSNTFATLPGIVSPILTGYVVRDATNLYQWRIVYYISAAIYLFGAVISSVFTSGEIQPWAEQQKSNRKEYHEMDPLRRNSEKESYKMNHIII